MSPNLKWTQIRYILPIKDENKRNFYINLCIEHNLSSRDLVKEIKSNSYERLVSIPNKIEIITPKENLTLTTNIRNPIIFYLKENEKIENEHDLEMLL